MIEGLGSEDIVGVTAEMRTEVRWARVGCAGHSLRCILRL